MSSSSASRKKKGSIGCAMMACCKGGAHAGEYVKFICLQEQCRAVDLVLCAVCRRKSHSSHAVIEINDLFEQLKHRVNGKRVRDYSAIGALVHEAESVCMNSLANFESHFIAKLQQLQDAMHATFSIWKEESSLFEERHALAVIDDIASMQQECDAALFTSQLRKILPHISFSTEDSTVAAKRSQHSQQQLQQRPATIKGISKNLLGLPPVSKDEVHSFQQSLLHSLKKVSETLTESLASIRYAKSRSNSSAASNRSYMTEYAQSQSRMNSDVDDVISSSQFMGGQQNLFDSICLSQSNAASVHRMSRYSSIEPVEVIPAVVSAVPASANLSKYRGQQVQSARTSNATTPRRAQYISAKGQYKAVDLISHYTRGAGENEYESDYGTPAAPDDDRLAVDVRRILRSRQGSVYSQAGSSSVASTQSVNGKFYLTNQGISTTAAPATAYQTVPAAGVDSIHQVQRQVTGIQRSIDNLRGSVDFQKILTYLDDKNSRNANTSNSSTPVKSSLGGKRNSGQAKPTAMMMMAGSPSTDSVNFFSQNTSVANTPKSQIVNGGFQNAVEQAYSTGVESARKSAIVNNNYNANATYNSNHGHASQASSPFGKRVSSSSTAGTPSSIGPAGAWRQRMGDSQLSFAEKFSRFQEMSSARRGSTSASGARGDIVNGGGSAGDAAGVNSSRNGGESESVYSRFMHDSRGVRELVEDEEDAKRVRDVASNQKKVHFRFSADLHHEFVKVSKYIASGQKESFLTRLVLLEPTVEILPHRETTFSFLIKSCKNEEHAHPLALGLCHKNIVSSNNFEFAAQNLNEHTSVAAIDKLPHGCYLLTATGFLRNHAYLKQDMKKVPVRFGVNDIIVCTFNPFKKTLQFTKKSSGETCILNVDTIPTDKLYPCIRISYAQDSVEYIPS